MSSSLWPWLAVAGMGALHGLNPAGGSSPATACLADARACAPRRCGAVRLHRVHRDGTGLMLVPALVPLCLPETPARELTASGSMLLALAAVGVHAAAMLCAAGAAAWGACRLAHACGARRRDGIRHAHAVPQTGD
jgi:hypothetical protein